jgi:hypothetical protein
MTVERKGDELMNTNSMISPSGGDRMFALKSFRRLLAGLILLLPLGLASCDALDNLISVEAPSQVAAQDLDNPANADLLVNSAVNDFRCALVHFIAAGAYVGNEWGVGGDTGGGSYVWYDGRVFSPTGWTSMYATGDCSGTAPNVYEPLSTSRWLADDALRRLDEWGDAQVPNRTALTAKAAAFAGYSLLLLGESMCSIAIDLGPELMPDAVFTLAEERFTRAMENAQTVGDSDILNLARVGRARTRLNLGDGSGAAADAGQVPEGFEYSFSYSAQDPSTENKLYVLMVRELMATVEPMYRSMTFQGQPDPRVVAEDLGLVGPGTDIEIWAAPKYSSLESPVPVATWEEAQLILAEAALDAGQLQQTVDIINVLHDRVGLPHFISTNAAEVREQLIYERSAELFLEGQHMQDLERFNLTLIPAPGTPFPHGGVFGDQICFPLPEVEYLNNPNINR